MASDRKSFGQICTVARALDVVGDRWTLLIVRELLGGHARFGELQSGLPGIAKNLLTERLRRLETDGLVERLNAGGSTLYALTGVGSALRPVVESLGRWGAKAPKLAPLPHDRSTRSIAVALQTFLAYATDALPEHPRVIELAIDDESLEISLGPHPSVVVRPSPNAEARVRTTRASMTDYLHGRAFDKRTFALTDGDKDARAALLRAMAVMF